MMERRVQNSRGVGRVAEVATALVVISGAVPELGTTWGAAFEGGGGASWGLGMEAEAVGDDP